MFSLLACKKKQSITSHADWLGILPAFTSTFMTSIPTSSSSSFFKLCNQNYLCSWYASFWSIAMEESNLELGWWSRRGKQFFFWHFTLGHIRTRCWPPQVTFCIKTLAPHCRATHHRINLCSVSVTIFDPTGRYQWCTRLHNYPKILFLLQKSLNYDAIILSLNYIAE